MEKFCLDCGTPINKGRGGKAKRCSKCAGARNIIKARARHHDKSATLILVKDPSEWPIKAGMHLHKSEVSSMKAYNSFTPGTILENLAGVRYTVVETNGKQNLVLV